MRDQRGKAWVCPPCHHCQMMEALNDLLVELVAPSPQMEPPQQPKQLLNAAARPGWRVPVPIPILTPQTNVLVSSRLLFKNF